eukprot:10251364-Alexandrium_andersonii.AAC.1
MALASGQALQKVSNGLGKVLGKRARENAPRGTGPALKSDRHLPPGTFEASSSALQFPRSFPNPREVHQAQREGR